MHYTTTLNDADIIGPITVAPDLGIGEQNLRVGNLANRVDSLNLTIGTQATIHKTNFSNGFSVPIRTGTDRGYDFEYSLSINRAF